GGVELGGVLPTARLLVDSGRETIARVFTPRVLPYYGCGEIQSLGYTCPDDASVYHTCDEHAVIEVEGPDGGAALTGEGAFLVTDLDNHAMPLIRYRNRHAAAPVAPGWPCRRTLARIVRLDGRVNDVLYTTAGAAISGVIGTHTFKMVDGVEQFLIVQRRPGQVEIDIVRRASYAAAVEEPKIERI